MSTFDDLSDYDFELLVADLLAADLSRPFETFPRGRDGGIDLRSRMGNGMHLVQCKHYPRSSIGRLVTAAGREKRTLADVKPRPRRYTFVTSRPLTRENKDKILAALRPLARTERDVLGGNDLERLLRKHPQVERAHVKLWLSRAAPLERIVNAEVYARSEALLEEIRAALPRYVQTASFAEARKLLFDHRVVIVAGPPGVGKTTLARLLMLDSAESGFVPYAVQADIAEAWRLHKTEEPQVFFFDDFLGRTALFDSVADDARDLANFIRRARRSPSTRLILSTREYVLRDAEAQVEEMQWSELEADKFSLTLKRYSRFERARIFYNHIYAAPEIDRTARRSLLRRHAYLQVIDHRSYNPRLIEWMTGLGGHHLADDEKSDYAAFCLGVLANPTRIWEYAFEQGLGRVAQVTLYVLVTLSPVVRLTDLQQAFDAAATSFGFARGTRNLDRVLKLLQESFITVSDGWFGKAGVSLLNPSLDDFLRQRIVDCNDDLLRLASGCHFFEQVEWLVGLAQAKGATIDSDLATALAECAERTIGNERPVGLVGLPLSSRGNERTTLVERVDQLAAWSETDETLAAGLRPALRALIPTVTNSVSDSPRHALRGFVKLLRRLSGMDVPVDLLTEAVRSAAAARADLAGYETLSDLRDELPGLFSIRAWADIQDGFAGWAQGRLDDPEWFDDIEEFERLEALINDFEVEVDEEAFDTARDHVELEESERVAEAMRDVEPEPDDDDERRAPRSSFDEDTLRIESLFGSLGHYYA